jgi:replicative DNA helicase
MTAQYRCAADVLANWRDDLLSGTPPALYPVGTGALARIEVGPGLVTLFGGPPGSGKTAFTMQAAVDALRVTSDLHAVVCNVEMSPKTLLDRQLARLSGVDLPTIRHRRLTLQHADRIEAGIATLESVTDRLYFVRPPFSIENIAATADAVHADMLLFDYIQRISPPGNHGDRRSSVDATMNYLRQFAEAGQAVMVVSAVTRGKDSRGQSTYDGRVLNLASFRESSELEFGADDAFMLAADPETNTITLRHMKSRHGEAADIELIFNGAIQRFHGASDATHSQPQSGSGPLSSALQAMWEQTEPADDHPDGDPDGSSDEE